jgi:hypothetical protein
MNAIGRRVARGRPELMLTVGIALLVSALVAGFWPHSVTLNGSRRSCSPVVGDMVPSDPGPSYPEALIEACAANEQPERLTMGIGGLAALLIGGLGGAGLANRRSRQQLFWTPPPNWPAAPPGWLPVAGWMPPPEWPPPPTDWQWWQSAEARLVDVGRSRDR